MSRLRFDGLLTAPILLALLFVLAIAPAPAQAQSDGAPSWHSSQDWHLLTIMVRVTRQAIP